MYLHPPARRITTGIKLHSPMQCKCRIQCEEGKRVNARNVSGVKWAVNKIAIVWKKEGHDHVPYTVYLSYSYDLLEVAIREWLVLLVFL